MLRTSRLNANRTIGRTTPGFSSSRGILILCKSIPLVDTRAMRGLLSSRPANNVTLLAIILSGPVNCNHVVHHGNPIVTVMRRGSTARRRGLVGRVGANMVITANKSLGH